MTMQFWIPVGLGFIPVAVAWFAYSQATKVARIAAISAERTKLVDDLQEEVAALRAVVGEARSDADALRYRLRAVSEYLDLCLARMRQNSVEPPPVPAMARRPWEEP